jgi:hypothetical protein
MESHDGEQSAFRVLEVNLNQQGARAHIDRVSGPNDFSREFLARKLCENEVP